MMHNLYCERRDMLRCDWLSILLLNSSDCDQLLILFFRPGPWDVCSRSYSQYEGVSGLRPWLWAPHLQSVHKQPGTCSTGSIYKPSVWFYLHLKKCNGKLILKSNQNVCLFHILGFLHLMVSGCFQLCHPEENWCFESQHWWTWLHGPSFCW